MYVLCLCVSCVFEKKAFLMTKTPPIATLALFLSLPFQIRSRILSFPSFHFISITINHIDSFICMFVLFVFVSNIYLDIYFALHII